MERERKAEKSEILCENEVGGGVGGIFFFSLSSSLRGLYHVIFFWVLSQYLFTHSASLSPSPPPPPFRLVVTLFS